MSADRSNAREQAAFFESLHRGNPEPFSYSVRGIERLRHAWVAREASKLAPRRFVDVGCSRGQLTAQLAALGGELLAVDVSPTALMAARNHLRDSSVSLLAGNAMSIPIADGRVDLVIASDGLYSWNLDAGERDQALGELRRIVVPGGHLLFTEHTRPRRFLDLVRQIEQNGLTIVWVRYFYDRPWYQVESWFKSVQGHRWVSAARRSLRIARLLQLVGTVIGRRASRHVCVLARRPLGDSAARRLNCAQGSTLRIPMAPFCP